MTIPQLTNTDLGKSLVAAGTDSRSGSRVFDALVFTLASTLAYAIFCELVLKAGNSGVFASLGAYGLALGILSLVGAIQSTSGLPSWLAKRGVWRRTHCIESILQPLITPYLGSYPWQNVYTHYELFVQEVFEPFVDGSSNSVNAQHIRQFYKAFTHLKAARIVTAVSCSSTAALLIIWLYGNVTSTEVVVWLLASVGVALAAHWILERPARREIAECTKEEVAFIKHYFPARLQLLLRYACLRADNASVAREDVRPTARTDSTTLARQFDTPGMLELVIAERLLLAHEHVVFWAPRSLPRNWVFHLMPGIVYCRQRGIRVDVLLSGDGSGEIHSSFLFLRALGCNVLPDPPLPPGTPSQFSGVVVDPGSSTAHLLVSLTSGQASMLGFEMSGSHIQPLLTSLTARLPEPAPARPAIAPAHFSRMDEDVLVRRLKRVPEYRNCVVKMERIDVRMTLPMAKQIKRSSHAQVQEWLRLYADAGLELFEPAKLSLVDGTYSPILPPVLEQDPSGSYRVHEGHTRLHYLLNLSAHDAHRPIWIEAIVVEGAPRPPEGKGPWTWDVVDPVEDAVYDKDYMHSHSMELLTRGTRDTNRVFHWDLMSSSELGVVR